MPHYGRCYTLNATDPRPRRACFFFFFLLTSTPHGFRYARLRHDLRPSRCDGRVNNHRHVDVFLFPMDMQGLEQRSAPPNHAGTRSSPCMVSRGRQTGGKRGAESGCEPAAFFTTIRTLEHEPQCEPEDRPRNFYRQAPLACMKGRPESSQAAQIGQLHRCGDLDPRGRARLEDCTAPPPPKSP